MSQHNPPNTNHIIYLAMLLFGVSLLLSGMSGLAAGEIAPDNITDKAPYYNDSNTSVANETWMDGNQNATLENSTTFITRLSTFVVGTDASSDMHQAAGAMLTGLLLFGMTIGLTSSNRVGMTAGGVIGSATVVALIEAGFAPLWLQPVFLAILGILLGIVVVRWLR